METLSSPSCLPIVSQSMSQTHPQSPVDHLHLSCSSHCLSSGWLPVLCLHSHPPHPVSACRTASNCLITGQQKDSVFHRCFAFWFNSILTVYISYYRPNVNHFYSETDLFYLEMVLRDNIWGGQLLLLRWLLFIKAFLMDKTRKYF